jgi:hypothetical protein
MSHLAINILDYYKSLLKTIHRFQTIGDYLASRWAVREMVPFPFPDYALADYFFGWTLGKGRASQVKNGVTEEIETDIKISWNEKYLDKEDMFDFSKASSYFSISEDTDYQANKAAIPLLGSSTRLTGMTLIGNCLGLFGAPDGPVLQICYSEGSYVHSLVPFFTTVESALRTSLDWKRISEGLSGNEGIVLATVGTCHIPFAFGEKITVDQVDVKNNFLEADGYKEIRHANYSAFALPLGNGIYTSEQSRVDLNGSIYDLPTSKIHSFFKWSIDQETHSFYPQVCKLENVQSTSISDKIKLVSENLIKNGNAEHLEKGINTDIYKAYAKTFLWTEAEVTIESSTLKMQKHPDIKDREAFYFVSKTEKIKNYFNIPFDMYFVETSIRDYYSTTLPALLTSMKPANYRAFYLGAIVSFFKSFDVFVLNAIRNHSGTSSYSKKTEFLKGLCEVASYYLALFGVHPIDINVDVLYNSMDWTNRNKPIMK